MRAPRGGASCLGMGRPGSGTLPPPTARPLGGLLGPGTHWLWVRAGAGVGTRHQPHSARSCKLALRAVGAARGRLGGAPPAWVWGVWGRALSHRRLPALLPGCRGPLPTGCGGGRVRAWGPVTNPQRALLRAGFARCGGGTGAPGGAPLAWVWGVRGQALSHPRLPALSAGCPCVLVRALLGRVGRAGLPAAFWCASPFLWPFWVRSLLVRPPPGWGCPVCGCCWAFLFLLPLVAPPLCPALRVFRPRVH